MRAIRHDLRNAARGLARSPAFTALAVLTLALGVGAHAAIFGWVDATLLRPLPVPEPDRLVGIYETRDGAGFFPLSLPDFADYRERVRSLSALAAQYPVAPLILGPVPAPGEAAAASSGATEEIPGAVVSPEYFPVLGVEAARGRVFRPDEAGPPGAHPVAMVSHEFWRVRLGGRDDVLGTVLTLNDTAFTVVGVVPEGFHGVQLGSRPEVFLPTSMAAVGYRWCDPGSRGCTFVEMIGRLASGRTIEEARSEMAVLARQVHTANPSTDPTVRGLAVEPLAGVHPAARPRMLRLARLLLAAVTLVLLVAAANLGGLLVARNLSRRREIATRLAIGAGRWRVVAESVLEALLVAAGGTVSSLLVAAWVSRFLGALSPGEHPLDLGIGPAELGYAAALAVATALVVGLAAGLQASRPGLVAALRDEASMGGRRRPRVLGGLVVAQVALSFVLLAGAGLLVRSLHEAGRMGSVAADRVATLRLRPRLVGIGADRARPYTREVVRRLEALPGVEAVAIGRLLPPWGGLDATPGEPEVVEVGPRYFETFGVPLVRGRAFGASDRAGAEPVAIVNRALAEARWPGRDPIGEQLALGDRTARVVGVVEDAVYRSLTQVPPLLAYTPYEQSPELADARIGVLTAVPAAETLSRLRREVRAVDPAVPVTEVETFAARLGRLLGPVRLAERGIVTSAALTVLLAAIGLYGVLALAVTRRRRDIGIRIALGGTRARVVALVVRDALTLVGAAVALGTVVALLGGPALAHQLYGVSPRDPLAFGASLALFALVAAVASWWPARRAARVDPARTLRQS